jgi:hypothetical protein
MLDRSKEALFSNLKKHLCSESEGEGWCPRMSSYEHLRRTLIALIKLGQNLSARTGS